ncbi:MAG: sigma-70 family RNA polymerase sigma factor [Acidobacteria bacterium]|nr:sigma-70 family RNA polymerase sigma factor [Acidobacteriota bacterium]
MFHSIESDGRLVKQARKGNVEAFNQLISRWEKRLYNYLLRLIRHREDSLDVCQEAFLKAYRSLSSLDDPEKFPQWLFRIARNLAFSHLRRETPLERAESWPEDDGEDAIPHTRTSTIPIGSARSMFALELEHTVAKALECLTPEQQEAIVLKVYHGFRFAEIAEILSCPVSTVKSRIYSGFSQLRELLSETTADAISDRRR